MTHIRTPYNHIKIFQYFKLNRLRNIWECMCYCGNWGFKLVLVKLNLMNYVKCMQIQYSFTNYFQYYIKDGSKEHPKKDHSNFLFLFSISEYNILIMYLMIIP